MVGKVPDLIWPAVFAVLTKALHRILSEFKSFTLWVRVNKENFAIVGVIFAVISFSAGYVNGLYKDRQKNAFDILGSLRNKDFVELHAKFYKSLNSGFMQEKLGKFKFVTSEYADVIYEQFRNDDEYMVTFYKLNDVYAQIAWCGITRLCDPHTICEASWANIQEFHSTNVKIYGEWNKISNSQTDYSMTQLDEICDKKDVINFFRDQGLRCSLSILLRGWLNLYPGNVCTDNRRSSN